MFLEPQGQPQNVIEEAVPRQSASSGSKSESEFQAQCCVGTNTPNCDIGIPSLSRHINAILSFSEPAATSISTIMSEPSSSYANIPTPDEEVDSLPSSSAGSSTSVSPSEEEAYSDAEREWRESLQQLELMLTLVLIPYLGKYFGRKCAYWGEWDEMNRCSFHHHYVLKS